MLYRNMYWLLYFLDLRFVLFLCTTAVWQFAINEYVMLCYSPEEEKEGYGGEDLQKGKVLSLEWKSEGVIDDDDA